MDFLYNVVQWLGHIWSEHHPIVVCFSVAATVGLLVAIVELLSRYGAGNRPEWILLGKPQYLFFVINALAAMVGLFVSEAMGQTMIVSAFSQGASLSIIKTVGVAMAAMFALRSSLFAVENKDNDTKVDVGPAQVINVLNQYLDHQIDKSRREAAIDDVSKFIDKLNPDRVLPDILPILISATEAYSPDVLTKLKKDIEMLHANRDGATRKARAFAMALRIQKLLGTDALQTVVESLEKATPEAIQPVVNPVVESYDSELDSLIGKFMGAGGSLAVTGSQDTGEGGNK